MRDGRLPTRNRRRYRRRPVLPAAAEAVRGEPASFGGLLGEILVLSGEPPEALRRMGERDLMLDVEERDG